MFLSNFTSFLYMFRATVFTSSGETSVFMQHCLVRRVHPAYQTVIHTE